jgi:hypothetical protein
MWYLGDSDVCDLHAALHCAVVTTLSHAVICSYCKNMNVLMHVLLGKENLWKCQRKVFLLNFKVEYQFLNEDHQAGKVLYNICCYWTQEFITTAHHWTLSWACSTQFPSSHSVSRTSFLILCSHLRLGHQSVLLPKSGINNGKKFIKFLNFAHAFVNSVWKTSDVSDSMRWT